MATHNTRPSRSMDERHVSSRLWRRHPIQSHPVDPQFQRPRYTALHWILCAGLLGAGLLAPGLAQAAHWPEFQCLVEATENPLQPHPTWWEAAQELGGHTVDRAMPVYFIAPWPEGHGVYGNQRLGGCFNKERWAIQIMPQVTLSPAMLAPMLIHELTHAVLDDRGMVAERHHCWMNETEFASRLAKWLYHHEQAVHPATIGFAVLKAGIWRGWRAAAPFVSGLALPAFFLGMAVLGRESSGVFFMAGTTIGFFLTGLAVTTSRRLPRLRVPLESPQPQY